MFAIFVHRMYVEIAKLKLIRMICLNKCTQSS